MAYELKQIIYQWITSIARATRHNRGSRLTQSGHSEDAVQRVKAIIPQVKFKNNYYVVFIVVGKPKCFIIDQVK